MKSLYVLFIGYISLASRPSSKLGIAVNGSRLKTIRAGTRHRNRDGTKERICVYICIKIRLLPKALYYKRFLCVASLTKHLNMILLY